MQEKRLSRILGIYRSNPSGSVLKVWKSYPESFYKKLVNKRFFLKIRDNPTFGITAFFAEMKRAREETVKFHSLAQFASIFLDSSVNSCMVSCVWCSRVSRISDGQLE